MFFPYRVKNPPKRFPYATVTLIALNVLVYAFTTEYFLFIREAVVMGYAFEYGRTSFINLFTSAFLHADIFHLLGNMLFLWVFGPSVEDRLRIPLYAFLYFTTGAVGYLMQAAMDVSLMGSPMPVIGASGCIMGVVGAYWYLFSWSTVCVWYWIGIFWRGVWEVSAIWIIGLYMVMDFFTGVTGTSGGVASMAHVVGGVVGLIICFAFRIKRDTQQMSEARAVQSDSRDIANMPLYALETMLEEDPGNPELIRAMIMPALKINREASFHNEFAKAGSSLIDKDPSLVSYYLLDLRGRHEIYQPIHLLRLAGMLERRGDPVSAINIYRLLVGKYPESNDVETALYRAALCSWNSYRDPQSAKPYLAELGKRFPNGELIPHAKSLWKQISGNG